MSFQGDVRGIGLAELLQGLARGRKEGVLTLSARGRAPCTLGLEAGNLVLLPNPDEDIEIWRTRVRDAWAADPTFRVDHLRMSETAQAQRTENLFCILDGEGVHFRFDPGPLPDRGRRPDEEPGLEGGQGSVYCEGTSVEYLLLEYARLADELASVGEALDSIRADAVPLALELSMAQSASFQREVDGLSTLREIADRMGWPIRQARLTLWCELRSGALRLAAPEEVFQLATNEMSRNNFSRAAARLSAWCNDAPSGWLRADQAEMLAAEWQAGRLMPVLGSMPQWLVRSLLRRLDNTLQDPLLSAAIWEHSHRRDPKDRISRLHYYATCFAAESNPAVPSVRELLDLARDFRDQDRIWRAGPAFVMAAHKNPSATAAQFELGLGLLTIGRVEDGAPWIIAAATELLTQGQADRVLTPLRTLLVADPRNREARQLFTRARRSSTRVRNLRKNLLITAASVTLVSFVAAVRVRAEQEQERRVREVRSLLNDPPAAIARLELNFPRDVSPEVVALRDEVLTVQRERELQQRAVWGDLYREAQAECNTGDPILGLRRILELPEPPELLLVKEPWPLKSDLYHDVSEHLIDTLNALGTPVEGAIEQVRVERQVTEQVEELRKIVGELKRDPDIVEFLQSLERVDQVVRQRDVDRARIALDRRARQALDHQDALLKAAQQYADSGDFQRAIRMYDELLSMDPDGRIAQVLEKEIADLHRKDSAVSRARELALEGRHREAFQLLSRELARPELFVLPWHVDSFPSGADVQLKDGSTRTTPFDIETTYTSGVLLAFEYEGYEKLILNVEHPMNLFVYLSRTPERRWRTGGRVDAMPLPLGEDHVFADRHGNVARVGKGGEVVWEAKVDTLSGIMRPPAPMPARPDALLLVTEEGHAWILGAEDGAPEGPWDLEVPPVAGPYVVDGEVCVRLKSGELACFGSSLRPTIKSASRTRKLLEREIGYRNGSDQGLKVLRQRVDMDERLASPWNDWAVEVLEEAFHVYTEADPEGGYTVRREDNWVFLAWEAPHTRLPDGRLWVSDGAGIRAFVPAAQ